MGVTTQNRLFLMENTTKMDDLGGTPISGNLHISIPRDAALCKSMQYYASY